MSVSMFQTHTMLPPTTQTLSNPLLVLDPPIGHGRGWNVTSRRSRPPEDLAHMDVCPLAASLATVGNQPNYHKHQRSSWMTAMDRSDDQRPSSSTSWILTVSEPKKLSTLQRRQCESVRVEKNLGRTAPQKPLLPRSIGVGRISSHSHEQRPKVELHLPEFHGKPTRPGRPYQLEPE